MKNVDIDQTLYLLLYVDNMLITSKCIEAMNGQKKALLFEFEMKDLDLFRKILRIDICRDRSKCILHLLQRSYV